MIRFLELLFEIFGWIRIVASPLLICFAIGAVAYLNIDDKITGITIVIVLSFLGLIIGIIWANRVWKKHGTMHFLSRIHETPDVDEWLKKESEKNK